MKHILQQLYNATHDLKIKKTLEYNLFAKQILKTLECNCFSINFGSTNVRVYRNSVHHYNM